ncbi:MAG: HAD hydrolase family protein [Psychrobacter sp.]|nr:HAD hydrolase family protein [Psychrobacter sp.]
MTPAFFQPSSAMIQPYALMDLDDTLFQTQRKIDAWQLLTCQQDELVCATVNKQGEPLSFMTPRQSTMVNWLLACTELIPVTARDTQEIKRVKLPFNSWQVLTHGAVILSPNGDALPDWQAQMHRQLAPLQDKVAHLIDVIKATNQSYGQALKLAIHSDVFLGEQLTIYLAIKHQRKDHQALADLAQRLPSLLDNLTDDFYIHVNANNLAILPHCVHKHHAVQYLLTEHLDNSRPSFGFGDSLADLPFLQLLDWYGTPNHGQLHDAFKI